MPRSISGRERFARRCRFSASLSNNAFFVRSSSDSSSAMVPCSSPIWRFSAGSPAAAAFASAGAAPFPFSRSAFAFSVAPVLSTWPSREPSRYTVTPLQFRS